MEENTPLLSNGRSQQSGIEEAQNSSNQRTNPPPVRISFVDEKNIDPELFCTICQQVYNNPVRSVNCGHSFCKDCIDNWSQINSTCPLDKIPLGQLQFDRLAFNLIENFETDCQQCTTEPHWRGPKSLLRVHLKDAHGIEIPTLSNSQSYPMYSAPAQMNNNPANNYPQNQYPVQQRPMPQYPQQYQNQQQYPSQERSVPQYPQHTTVVVQQSPPGVYPPQNGQFQVRCFYHEQMLCAANCTTCGRAICQNCTRVYFNYRWGVTNVLCPACARRRYNVFIILFVIFLVTTLTTTIVIYY